MARPRKQGLDYFPLDVDFFEDDKVVMVSGEFGLKSEIVILRLLCQIYANGYYLQWTELSKMRLTREISGMTPQSLEMILNRLIKVGFFDRDLFEQESILTSTGIQRRYFEATRFRKQELSELKYLLISPENQAAREVKSDLTTVPASKVPQDRTGPGNVPDRLAPTATKYVARSEFLEKFFSSANAGTINNVCDEIGITPEEFRAKAEAVINEWHLTEKRHRDYSDAASNLISHVRRKSDTPKSSRGKKEQSTGIDPQALARTRKNAEKHSGEEPAERTVTYQEWAMRRNLDPSIDATTLLEKEVTAEKERMASLFPKDN